MILDFYEASKELNDNSYKKLPTGMGFFYHNSRHIFYKTHSLGDKNELHVVISSMIDFLFDRMTRF